MSAVSSIIANCGCGFISRSERAPKVVMDAIEHAKNTGHSVDLLGTIRGKHEQMYFTAAASNGANGGATRITHAAPIRRDQPIVSTQRRQAIARGQIKKQ